ncbi:adenylate kinase [Kushneria pakistanensis]|uniref:Adenylate kinase n=1 Tax=Kushneria pakistanensis TaxID=1508770 RepID=A0ABQ3FIF5_9GAMM|nr:shikimate kinase [Kushneria pakistanensis]GHC25408.1 adenylate kinase [Kushneria pakistanensis]
MKINVVGTTGAGKSTLARRLSEALSLPYIEMDAFLWLPNWQEKPDAQFLAEIEDVLTASPGWVLDGNFDRSRAIKWRDVDMVIWVDTGFCRTMVQAITRAVRRAWTQQELWPGTGNRESFRKSFFSRDSVLLWTLKTWRRNRRRYVAAMADPRYRHIRFVRLCNRDEIDRFVRVITGQPACKR